MTNSSTAAVDGYVVEYGGLPNDPVVTLAGDVTVNVVPVNDAPTDIALSKSNVDENLPVDTLVGSFSATDVDGGPTFSYSLVSGPGADDNSRFAIAGAQLKTAVTFDFETKNSYTIRVRVLDGKGGSFEKIFPITINDRDVTPTFAPPLPPLPVRYGSDFHYAAVANGEPFTMTYSAAGLPTGMSINPATGEIAGKPTQVGTFQVTITANNGASNPGPATGSFNISIEVQKAALTAKAADQTVKIGQPIPLQILYSGFVLGDDVGDLDQPGQLTYPGAPALPALGTYNFSFATNPADGNYVFTLVPGKLDVVSKDVPQITWPTPADIVYGTQLSGAQLNATAAVSGTFVYSPQRGHVARCRNRAAAAGRLHAGGQCELCRCAGQQPDHGHKGAAGHQGGRQDRLCRRKRGAADLHGDVQRLHQERQPKEVGPAGPVQHRRQRRKNQGDVHHPAFRGKTPTMPSPLSPAS